MRASAGTAAQLYWSTDLTFVDQRMVLLPIRAGEDFQWLRFPLPSTGGRWLRFDPTNGPGEVSIRATRVVDANNTIVEVLKPERLHPYQQIASMTNDGAVTRLVTIPGATDASFLMSLSSLDTSIGNRIALVTPASLAIVTSAVLLLLIACVVVILRDALGGVPGDSASTGWRRRLWIAALFLIVFSASLLFIRQNPVTVPDWDQWDIEASWLYVPYHEGALTWRSMFSLANEHRVFFTRLLALDLLLVNGQWDPRLQQVVNAGMHAMTAVLLVAVLYVGNRRRHLDAARVHRRPQLCASVCMGEHCLPDPVGLRTSWCCSRSYRWRSSPCISQTEAPGCSAGPAPCAPCSPSLMGFSCPSPSWA